jgi:hypothetical protein
MSATEIFNQEKETLLGLCRQFDVTLEDAIDIALALKYNRVHSSIPQRIHLRLLDLFCRSSGSFQEALHHLRLQSRLPLAEEIVLSSPFFQLSPSEFTLIVHEIQTSGYCQLPFSLPAPLVSRILENSLSYEYDNCLFADNRRLELPNLHSLPLPSGLILAHAKNSCVMADPLVRSIIYDPVILSLVSLLLGGNCMVRHVSCWYSYPSAAPSSEAAQLFHFDLDEFRWLKLFIFLSDVDHLSGPHVYIPGTHKPYAKPDGLLKLGYSRITDDMMSRYHPVSSWETLTCKIGTMVLADTRCWHKGTSPIMNTRVVLQPEYSLSSFGRELF